MLHICNVSLFLLILDEKNMKSNDSIKYFNHIQHNYQLVQKNYWPHNIHRIYCQFI